MSYNGWQNWETWIVNLYFGDDTEGIQQMAEDTDFDLSDMADVIESMVSQYVEDTTGQIDGIVGEFIRSGLRQVSWRELAENWLSGCEKPEEEEEIDEWEEESAYHKATYPEPKE